MKTSRNLIAVSRGFVLLALLSATASGSEIYKWSGSDGVTHYGEAPPEAGLASFEILEVVATSPVPPAAVNYQSVLDVASSIEASRLARERARLEREKLFLQERKLAAQQQYYSSDAGGVYYMPYYRYQRPHGPHKPLKPYPYKYGHRPVPAPYSDGGQAHSGSTQGRVNLGR